MKMRQWPSIRVAIATEIKPSIELEPNIDNILGPMNVNGNITYLSQTNKSFEQPFDLEFIQIKCTSHLYNSMIPEDWYT